MSDIEHIAIERLRAASEMSLANYGLPISEPHKVTICKHGRRKRQ